MTVNKEENHYVMDVYSIRRQDTNSDDKIKYKNIIRMRYDLIIQIQKKIEKIK